jgi:hypothetical protein
VKLGWKYDAKYCSSMYETLQRGQNMTDVIYTGQKCVVTTQAITASGKIFDISSISGVSLKYKYYFILACATILSLSIFRMQVFLSPNWSISDVLWQIFYIFMLFIFGYSAMNERRLIGKLTSGGTVLILDKVSPAEARPIIAAFSTAKATAK